MITLTSDHVGNTSWETVLDQVKSYTHSILGRSSVVSRTHDYKQSNNKHPRRQSPLDSQVTTPLSILSHLWIIDVKTVSVWVLVYLTRIFVSWLIFLILLYMYLNYMYKCFIDI